MFSSKFALLVYFSELYNCIEYVGTNAVCSIEVVGTVKSVDDIGAFEVNK